MFDPAEILRRFRVAQQLLPREETPVVTVPALQRQVALNLQKFQTPHPIELISSMQELEAREKPAIVVVPSSFRAQADSARTNENLCWSQFLYWSYTDSFTPADFFPPKNWEEVFKYLTFETAFTRKLKSGYAESLLFARHLFPTKGYTIQDLFAFETLLEVFFDPEMKSLKVTNFYENDRVYISADDRVIDGGACSSKSGGEFVTSYARRVGFHGKVYAFEPVPEVFEELLEDTAACLNVVVINAALWRSSSQRRILSDGIGSTLVDSSSLGRATPNLIEVDINTTTIDDIGEQDRVTFIKLDIEGSEIYAIDGAQQTIQKHSPKLSICVYHSPEDFIAIPAAISKFGIYDCMLECNEGHAWAGTKILARKPK